MKSILLGMILISTATFASDYNPPAPKYPPSPDCRYNCPPPSRVVKTWIDANQYIKGKTTWNYANFFGRQRGHRIARITATAASNSRQAGRLVVTMNNVVVGRQDAISSGHQREYTLYNAATSTAPLWAQDPFSVEITNAFIGQITVWYE